MIAAAFDRLAPRYDQLWTRSTVGHLQREAVWRHLAPLFKPGQTALDLGCGTGEDALHLSGGPNVMRFSECPGKIYNALLEKDFERATPETQRPFLESLEPSLSETGRRVEVVASASVATSVAQVKGVTHVFLANFAGLVGGANPIQTPQTDVKISLPVVPGNAGYFLPFLGDVQKLQGAQKDGRETFVLPAINKGAVFWYAR